MNTHGIMKRVCLGLGIVALMGLVSCAEKFPVTFHMQGDDSDSTKMSFMQVIHGKPTKFVKAPIISNRDIENYRSFHEYKNGTYGAVFFLNAGAKHRYHALTTQNLGKLIIPMANGKPCEVFRVSAPYDKGVICIYSGLSKEDMNLMKEVIEPHPKEKEKMNYDAAQVKTKVDKLR